MLDQLRQPSGEDKESHLVVDTAHLLTILLAKYLLLG